MLIINSTVYKTIFDSINIELHEDIKKYNKSIIKENEINFADNILSNIREGILLLTSELDIVYTNKRFKYLFAADSDKSIREIFDKEIYKNIYNFSKNINDKYVFEWVIGSLGNPILASFILKFIEDKFILIVVSEINDVLAGKELEACYYIIRGYSERETAKLLYKSRTTVNSNKVRAKEKLKQNNLFYLLDKLT